MPSHKCRIGVAAVGACVLLAGIGAGSAAATASGKQHRIANALSAAPKKVARRAAVVDWPAKEGEEMPLLRKGSNAFTCVPDDPMTPSNDPQCLDKGGMEWMDAWMMRTKPKLRSPGMAYVLQGCTVASNTDPFAHHPKPGKKWIAAGPHVMIFPTGKLDRKTYGTDPYSGGPHIRWAGTPYEHLVIPVR